MTTNKIVMIIYLVIIFVNPLLSKELLKSSNKYVIIANLFIKTLIQISVRPTTILSLIPCLMAAGR